MGGKHHEGIHFPSWKTFRHALELTHLIHHHHHHDNKHEKKRTDKKHEVKFDFFIEFRSGSLLSGGIV